MIKLLSLTVLFLSFSGFFYNKWWGFAAAGLFRLQYLFLSFLGIAAGFYYSMPLIIIINAFSFAVNFYIISDWLPNLLKKQADNIDVASINSWSKNHKPYKLSKYLTKFQPEVLLLMEVTDKLKRDCADIFNAYPYNMSHYVRDGFEIWLLSKNPMCNTEVYNLGEGDTPLLSCKINLRGREYRIFSAHPRPAINSHYAEARHTYFEGFKKIILKEKDPIIVLGDFNSVPWEAHFSLFLEETKLISTLITCGYRITWPTYFLPFGIPMDHILVSDNISVNGVCVGPNVGSDHYPVGMGIDD